MFALVIAGSLALGAVFWGSALHGGAFDPRTAARVFGWLCVVSIALGFCLSLRRRTGYDRPSAALAGALATTLLTGIAVLYLSYFEWQGPIGLAAADEPAVGAAPGNASAAPREAAAAALPAPQPATSPPRGLATKKPRRVASSAATAKRASLARPDPCGAQHGVAAYQCRHCRGESGLSGFVCEENARAEYCTGRDGHEPGCPWISPAAMSD